MNEVYQVIEKLIRKYGKGDCELVERPVGSNAKGNKPQLHLYGRREVSILNRKLQKTYVAGVILQKHFVGFYSMPIYSHPKEFKLSSQMARMKKGKSCINLTRLTPELTTELENIIKTGIEIYKKEGWI